MRIVAVVPAGLGLVLLAAGVATAAGWVDWAVVGRWLGQHSVPVVLIGLGAALLLAALIRSIHLPGRRVADTPRTLSWWVVAAAGAVVVGVAWGATAWLIAEANQATDPAAARVEAIKTGLSIGAGTGGVFALLLAVRRQWHQEVSTKTTELDAAEKRITELYAKAADQLGSETAPVRLAGLYTLERVAQNSPDQRQTIIDVWCAYLRMPHVFYGREKTLPPENEDILSTIHESDVRLAIQRLLRRHLSPGASQVGPDAKFWPDIELDLTGATLLNFSIDDCVVKSADFTSVKFVSDAYFENCTFLGDAIFDSARFEKGAVFEDAEFSTYASFKDASFVEYAIFDRARFVDVVKMDRMRLPSDVDQVSFDQTTFSKLVPAEVEQVILAQRLRTPRVETTLIFDGS